MKAVIVRFEENKYSIKSERMCWWCRKKFWVSVEEIKAEFPGYEFHPEILPYTYNTAMQIYGILKK